MRRLVSKKLGILTIALMVITMVTGVAWAAASPSDQGGSIANVVAVPLVVPVGGQLQVAGAGFQPNEIVLFKIRVGGSTPDVTLQGGFANGAGAFLVDTTSSAPTGGLPESLAPGIYTIVARTVDGPVASGPLVVCETSEGKCANGE